jgi:hypothetical protein
VTRGIGLGVLGGRGSPEQGFHSSAIHKAGSSGGGSEGQLWAPARWSRGLTSLVGSLGWCRGGQRGARAVVHGGSVTVSKARFGAMQGDGVGRGGRSGGTRRRCAPLIAA